MYHHMEYNLSMKTNYDIRYKKIDTDAILHRNGICKCCGKQFINVDELENVYYAVNKDGTEVYDKKVTEKDRIRIVKYIESEENRWAIKGKKINNQIYYRNVCWHCYEKALYENVDVKRKARKNAWYRSIVENGFTPPPACVSPNTTFKYLFDIPEEELDKARAKLATASKKYWVDKLGEEAGEKRYNQIAERQAYTASTEYFVKEKGMTESEAKEFHQNRASTLKNFISRYGEEEGTKRWNEYCKQEAYAGNKIEYFINKYGEEAGRKKYAEVCDKKGITLEHFIERYGESEGLARWKEYLSSKSAYSRVSQELFQKLDNTDKLLKDNSQYAIKNGELRINVLDKETPKKFYADYAFFNKLIEFNGDL